MSTRSPTRPLPGAPTAAAGLWAVFHADLVRRRRSPRTIAAYRHTLRSFWAFIDPKAPLRATPNDLERYLDQPSKGRGRRAGPCLSGNTRATYAGQVRAFYTWAAAEDLTPRDRMARFVVPPTLEPIPRALRREELADLFSYLDLVEDPRLEVMVWLGYGAGLRAGEIARLRIEHVHLRDDPPWMLVHGKGSKIRRVELGPLVAEVLTAWLAGQPHTGPVLPDRRKPARGISPRWVSELLSAAMHEAGLADSGHALRHSFATELLKAGKGVNTRAVSRLLGHATTAVTERVYTRGWSGDSEASVKLLPDPRRRAQAT